MEDGKRQMADGKRAVEGGKGKAATVKRKLEEMLVVNTVADDPFAIDVAHHFGQVCEISDLISLKRFANSEFCPRFIQDEGRRYATGHSLDGRTVVLVSTCTGNWTRNGLAMCNLLIARAAKDNGAASVILVEPDLYYSAQDRGPRPEQGETAFVRDVRDLDKFDGQPFSSLLYAQLLRLAGVDEVVTVHNHSQSVQKFFAREFGGRFFNLSPAALFADYLVRHEVNQADPAGPGLVICGPDAGAVPFAREVHGLIEASMSRLLLRPPVGLLFMTKVRSGERKVAITPAADSPTQAGDLAGRDVIVFDDMVRTGHTITECCQVLKQYGARRVLFVVTHFHSSDEVKENLNHPAVDGIVTTNTIPAILNRDMQGRLRKKMLVLKIEKWIAGFLRKNWLGAGPCHDGPPYALDMSSKNPRWVPHEHLGDCG